jgi:hypothetical protein
MAYIPKVQVGEQYGYWTIKKIITCQLIECECRCGYKNTLRQTDLLRGVTTNVLLAT